MNKPSINPSTKAGVTTTKDRSNLWVVLAVVALLSVATIFLSRAQEQKKNDAASTETSMNTTNDSKQANSDADLKKRLTPEQYRVTKENGTEPAFHNEYWDNHKAGIYVDVISGEPLFASTDKFESGTGWPSFTRPIAKEHVDEKTDSTFGMKRTEVRSKKSDAHLGHIFDDGPQPTGMRYCVNSAALRFVPVEKLKKEGYGEFLPLFEPKK